MALRQYVAALQFRGKPTPPHNYDNVYTWVS